jgi:hypothetical protein
VFLISKSQLQRDILSDPNIAMPACSRREVASGVIDKRVLAVLTFLSRSGLKPTVGTLRCDRAYGASGFVPPQHLGDAITISHINGVPIASHQGSGSVTDTTIRTLLTLRGEFVPRQIVSLMRYPGAANTLARADHGDYIEVDFAAAVKRLGATVTKLAHSAGAGRPAPSALVVRGELTPAQWDQLIARIALLPMPKVAVTPSAAAIRDPQAATRNHGLGAQAPSSGP